MKGRAEDCLREKLPSEREEDSWLCTGSQKPAEETQIEGGESTRASDTARMRVTEKRLSDLEVKKMLLLQPKEI